MHSCLSALPVLACAGAGLADVSCREVAAFVKPSGLKPPEQMPYQLLMALGTKPMQ